MPRLSELTGHVAVADYSECAAIQKRLVEAADKLTRMASDVALARQVREYDGDRKKRALAVVAAPLLAAGGSSAAADTEARASELYQKSMQQLAEQLRAAEKTIAEYEAAKIQWETARSLLSMQRAMTANL